MSLASMFGRGSEWGISLTRDFWPFLSALGGFYVSHWEKYMTGIMYLPWLFDALQLVRSGLIGAPCVIRGSLLCVLVRC